MKKSDRLLFASFGCAVQSVSGLFLFPASTVRPSLRVKVCSGLVDVGISGVTGPRLPAPMTVTRELVSRELRCPAVAGVKSTQPFLANQLTWRLDTGGHHTLAAYAFCKGQERKRIRAIKGGSGKRPIWPKRPSKANKGKVNLFTVGVDAAKEAIYARLKKSEAGAG